MPGRVAKAHTHVLGASCRAHTEREKVLVLICIEIIAPNHTPRLHSRSVVMIVQQIIANTH